MDKKTKLFEYLTIGLFAIALLGGSVLAQIPALRPDYSEEEKRELAKFPEYSAETLADGSYFSSISLWFSDTFPFREQLVALNAAVESLHGKTSIQISGNVVEGDEIPDDAEASAPVEDEPIEEPPVEEGFHDDDGIDENYTDPEDPGAVQKFGAVLQVGDTAYEYYGFSESAAHAYASMVNDTAALLGENVQVYTMVVPNSMDDAVVDFECKAANDSLELLIRTLPGETADGERLKERLAADVLPSCTKVTVEQESIRGFLSERSPKKRMQVIK